jgi:hypothetical protein
MVVRVFVFSTTFEVASISYPVITGDCFSISKYVGA